MTLLQADANLRAMHKRHIALLILFFVALSLFLLTEKADNIVGKPAIRAIVSFDGNLIPSQQQDFIFYTFLQSSLQPVIMGNAMAKLELLIAEEDKIESLSLLSPIQTKKSGIGKATFDIPYNARPGNGRLSIIDEGGSVLIAFDHDLKLGSEPSMAVMPPESITMTGKHLKFKIATFCPKNGKAVPRVPIRVQMHSSSDIMTINRVIHSDMTGEAIFSTHISREAPEGLYQLEFSLGDKRQIFKVQILDRQRSAPLPASLMNIHDTGSALPQSLLQSATTQKPALTAKYQMQAHSLNPQLSDFSIEDNRLFFKYDSNNAGLRQIEVWQNGKAHFSSELPLTSGRSSLTLPKSVIAGQPASIRLLFAKESLVHMSNQSFIKPEPSTDIQSFLLQVANILSPHQHQLLNKLLSSDAELSIMVHGFTPEFSDEPFNQIAVEPAEAQQMAFPAVELQNKARAILEKSVSDSASKRFVIVEKELDVRRIPLKSLQIWLSPQSFYDNLATNLFSLDTTASSLAAEIEARALSYELLTMPEQSAEIERLEGLLLPLSEAITYPAHHKISMSDPNFKHLLRAAKRLGNIIQIPEQINQLILSFETDNDLIGPASPILREELSISQLTNALRPGGQARLEFASGAAMLNLTSDTVVYDLSTQINLNQQRTKLVNLRTYPIVVELITR